MGEGGQRGRGGREQGRWNYRMNIAEKIERALVGKICTFMTLVRSLFFQAKI